MIKNAAIGNLSTSNFKNLQSDISNKVINKTLFQDKAELHAVPKISLESTSASNFKNLHSGISNQVINNYLSLDKTETYEIPKISLESTEESSKHEKK